MVLVIFLICLHFNAEPHLWTKIWKSYGWICLHFNAGPHQTLGFYMEILWLDNCANKLNFFFNIWISTIEVFQQVLLTLERCVPPQDSFCRDLEVHSLSLDVQ